MGLRLLAVIFAQKRRLKAVFKFKEENSRSEARLPLSL